MRIRKSDKMWLEQNTKYKKMLYIEDAICCKQDKNGNKDFEELNFEAESERWFEKLLRLAV